MKDDLIITALAALVFAFAVAMVWLGVAAATVEMTYPEKKCVRVIPPTAGDCDHLPGRYEVQWVRPGGLDPRDHWMPEGPNDSILRLSHASHHAPGPDGSVAGHKFKRRQRNE